MTEKFYKCTLLTDLVLNSKLATEGNIETLNYIPGSVFLGVVAGVLYKDLNKHNLSPDEAYDIFHSGKISFGNASIAENNEISYPVPFDFVMEKGLEKLGKHPVYLQHLLNDDNHPKDSNGYKVQLKQKRTGFITASGKAAPKVEKRFALKSAQDAQTRRSKEGAMFGFESLKQGQEFIFSICFNNDNHIINTVNDALCGEKYIGKSRSAQYGHVKIEKMQDTPKVIQTVDNADYTLVYAQSNLCFFDEFGQNTFQPTAEDFGLTGTIDWSKTQLRTYNYSPWNRKRNTMDSLRTCIAAGSVFFIIGPNSGEFKNVGAYQAEGLGRIVVNPVFLKSTNGNALCDFIQNQSSAVQDRVTVEEVTERGMGTNSELVRFLRHKLEEKQNTLELSKAIHDQYLWATEQGKEKFPGVTASQWGAIRAYAAVANSYSELKGSLLTGENAYLKYGVAYERIWSKGNNLKNFEVVMEQAAGKDKPTLFIAKFAAEMAKVAPKK